jgi:hypothetical protein
MNIGMLWLDNSDKPLTQKVEGAAAYYRNKYSKPANVCFINPKDWDEQTAQAAGCTIKTNRSVMPNHFWIGIEG